MSNYYVQSNHCLFEENKALEVDVSTYASTFYRHSRMCELVESVAHEITPQHLQNFFADTSGDDLAINRKDVDGISNNASVIMAPHQRTFWAVKGPADEGEWIELSL